MYASIIQRKEQLKKKSSNERVLSFNRRKKFFQRVQRNPRPPFFSQFGQRERRTDLLFLIEELHNLGAIASFRANVVVHSIDLIPSLFRAIISAAFLKGSNKELHKRHPPLIPRDHRIRLNPRVPILPLQAILLPDWIILVPT